MYFDRKMPVDGVSSLPFVETLCRRSDIPKFYFLFEAKNIPVWREFTGWLLHEYNIIAYVHAEMKFSTDCILPTAQSIQNVLIGKCVMTVPCLTVPFISRGFMGSALAEDSPRQPLAFIHV